MRAYQRDLASKLARAGLARNPLCYNSLMKKTIQSHRAFTLVELIVSIGIIVLITGIVVANLTSSRVKARDAKRISDVGQIQLALELYFDRCKQYPAFVKPNAGPGDPATITLTTDLNNGCPDSPSITFGSYLSKLPTPPAGTTYDYVVNDDSRPTDYYLHVTLESTNDVVRDGLGAAPYGSFTCSDVAGSVEYCLSPR
jgi:type II secretory pathway pseudopilin PulG